MKVRKRELAKPGIYGTVDNPIVVNERDLREISETFPEIKKAPVSLNGHWPDPSKPRLGNVISVTFDETSKVLSGEVEEHDVLASVVDGGFFPDVSISGKRRAVDGKMYLHHLAYLGEEPPAIKDLINGIRDSLDKASLDDDVAASDAAGAVSFPSPSSRQLLLSDPEATAGSSQDAGKPTRKEESMDPLDEVVSGITDEAKKKAAGERLAELKAAGESAARYKSQLEALVKKYPDAGIELSDRSDPRVDGLMKQLKTEKTDALLRSASGKVPKAKQGLISALASTFSLSESVELSDGDKKVSKTQYEVFADLLESLPAPVQAGKLDLSDDGAEGKAVDLGKIKGKI